MSTRIVESARVVESSRPVAVVTGAAQGIGRRTAVVLAEAGFDLVLNDLHETTITSPGGVAAEVEATGAHTAVIAGDVSNEDHAIAMKCATIERFGRVDVLANNAGISFITPAELTTAEGFRRVLEVNLVGPFLLCREFGAAMLAAGSGSIVNVASIAGLAGVADRVAYNASKHGVVGLTRTLAAEWGGRGVRVNAVCPGWVKTEMDEKDSGSGAYSSADIEARTPMGRFASPDDIAQAIAFLAGPHSSYVNGHCLTVDGGWTSDASWDTLRLRKR
jgi:NAD(P)-dependent dehydrogenase (short-subunit alcohol dehydrogenase family)